MSDDRDNTLQAQALAALRLTEKSRRVREENRPKVMDCLKDKCPYCEDVPNYGGLDIWKCNVDPSVSIRYEFWGHHPCKANLDKLRANPHAATLFKDTIELRTKQDADQKRYEERHRLELDAAKAELQRVYAEHGEYLVEEAAKELKEEKRRELEREVQRMIDSDFEMEF